MVVVATVGFVLAADSEQGKTDARLVARPSAPPPGCSASPRTARRPPRGRSGQDGRSPPRSRPASAARSRRGSRARGRAARGPRGPPGSLEARALRDGPRRGAWRLARTRLIDAKGAQRRRAHRLGHRRQGLRPAASSASPAPRWSSPRGTGHDLLDAARRRRREAAGARRGRDRRPQPAPDRLRRPGLRAAAACTVAAAGPRASDGGLSGAALEVLAILIAALIAAFAFALTVSRSLQAQIQRPAQGRAADRPRATSGSRCRPRAATSSPRSAASSTRWPASSSARLEELQLERKRLREAIQRVGQSFAQDARARRAARDRGADGRRRRRRPRRARGGAHGDHGRFEESAGEGDVEPLRDASARPRRRRSTPGRRSRPRSPARSRSRTRCARRRAAAHPRHGLGRPRRATFTAGGARAVRLPRRPGRRLDRERGPARHGQAPGRHRRADRPVQPPPLPGGHRQRGRARQARRPRGSA